MTARNPPLCLLLPRNGRFHCLPVIEFTLIHFHPFSNSLESALSPITNQLSSLSTPPEPVFSLIDLSSYVSQPLNLSSPSSFHLLKMDPIETILATACEKVGCNGLRNFGDLGKMRQDTLEKRLLVTQRELTSGNMASVYAMWLQDQVSRIGGAERTKVVRTFCKFLNSWQFDPERILDLWDDCAKYALILPGGNSNRMVMHMDAVRNEIIRVFPNSRAVDAHPRSTRVRLGSSSSNSFRTSLNTSLLLRQQRDPGPKDSKALPRRINNDQDSSRAWREEGQRIANKWANTPFSHEVKPLVPTSYVCKRCGVKGRLILRLFSCKEVQLTDIGHLIQDCPTNSDPDWDPPPGDDYVCHICGARGEHYITNCPKTISEKEPSLKLQPLSENEESRKNHCLGPDWRRNSREGRLSPWEVVRSVVWLG